MKIFLLIFLFLNLNSQELQKAKHTYTTPQYKQHQDRCAGTAGSRHQRQELEQADEALFKAKAKGRNVVAEV